MRITCKHHEYGHDTNCRSCEVSGQFRQQFRTAAKEEVMRRLELQKLRAFAERFLNPEDLGYLGGEALRDEAREALGIPRVIKAS